MSSANTPTPTFGPLDPWAATALPLHPGDVVAERYEVLRLLGSGGSAFVYAVRDRKIGHEIALKSLRPNVDLKRTVREAKYACGSDSPRLVRAFDLLESEGMVYLTMELVPGGSLRDLLGRGPLPTAEVIRLACEILEALVALHRLDVVHRDLKPANLLLTADDHIKLSDFGIARRWTDDESRLTRTGVAPGTIDYYSPEQAAGEKVDPRSDLYAFGVVLFEMLAGRIPEKRLYQRSEDVRKWRRDTPRWLAAIVARLLELKPEDRYASAEEALADLRRKRTRMRWRWMPAAAVAVLVVLGAGVGVWRTTRVGEVQLVVDEQKGLRVIDARGKELWSRPEMNRAVIVRRGDVQEVAAILRSSRDPLTDAARKHTLWFFDLRTGHPLRHRDLESAASSFPNHSDVFGAGQIRATDLNRDGYSEVAVAYNHDYWPCYIAVHDLRRDEGYLVFVASGQHTIQETADVDGDRVEDLIVSGVSNKMGWYMGVAAIRVPFGAPNEPPAYTSDRADHPRSRSLLWYALTPPSWLQLKGLTVDRSGRRLRLDYNERNPLVLTFPTPHTEASRERAYAHLRDSKRLTTSGDMQGAIAEAESARSIAASIGDPWLEEWSQRVKGMAMVQSGDFDGADAFFTRLASGSESASNTAYDAGTAFHLAGDLTRAVHWYRQALGRDGRPFVGRLKYESLQGLVLALGEMGRWAEAEREVTEFEAAYTSEAGNAPWYRHYIAWRTGQSPRVVYDISVPHDLYRYWALELELARGADPNRILALIAREQPRTSETRTLLLLTQSEALRRAGRIDEALQVARDAVNKLRDERRGDTLARAHFDLAVERLSRLPGAGTRME